MNEALAIIIPQVLIFLFDLVILQKILSPKTENRSQHFFKLFAASVCVVQGLSLTVYASDVNLFSMPIWIEMPIYVFCLTSLTVVSFLWFLYFISQLESKRVMSKTVMKLYLLPIILFLAVTILSPWTHWIFFLDDEMHYHYGTMGFMQALTPFVYTILALIIARHEVRYHNPRKAKKHIRQYLVFVIPALLGTGIQMMVFRGGYTQICLSLGMMLMYLELYVDQIAENRRLRSVTLLNEELKRANESKTIFLNNMSHDIRTPMNAIIGFAELMEKQKDNPAVMDDYLAKIKRSSQYLLSLINDVLDMARIESGKMELDEEFFDMMDPNNNVIILFDEQARQKNITLTFQDDVQHRYVRLDKVRTQQIIMNLMSNALKYTPEGGTVNYTFQELPSQREGYATYVSTIADNGIGMSQQFVLQIFEMFSRERNTTESKVSGTGLGMSIVKKLVDLMGGTLEIDTELGKGTTIRVTMSHPIVPNPEEFLRQQKQETHPHELNDMRILLAEDNELNAEIVCTILEEAGLQVERAEDGVECIKMLSEAEPDYYDVVLMDVQMPRMNGYDATRHIRAFDDRKKASIPIIALTANALEEDKRRALEAGMNSHLAKPIDVAALMQMLTELKR